MSDPAEQPASRGALQDQKDNQHDAETFWRETTHDWYPNMHSKTYFVPPFHFNQVSYDVQTVARQSVLVPQEASDQPDQASVYFPPSGPPPHPSDPPLASRVWPSYQSVPPGPLPVVYDADVRGDGALQQVLHFIRDLAEREQLVMLVLSQLEFRKYLDNQVDPINAAAIRLLPRPETLWPNYKDGDFDVLMINERYGLIVGEVKSVGADLSKTTDLHKAVLKAVERAVKQLNKAEVVLRHLVSDLASIRITKTLMLPNITSTQLLQVLCTNPQAEQDLCQCVGAGTDRAAAVTLCLTADSLTSNLWWLRAVTDFGPDSNMTPDLYEILVARFCGPATTIEIPTITTPRRTVQLRTMSEAVALTGLTMAMLTLYPEQVDLVNRSGLPRVFLWGPPGTGKTVVLVLKGMQWRHQGKDVHLLSSHRNSRAANWLINHQLLNTPGIRFTATSASSPLVQTSAPALGAPIHSSVFQTIVSAFMSTKKTGSTRAPGPRVYTHFYDFANKEDVTDAVQKLASVARNGELFVIADEAFSVRSSSGRFAEFCTLLARRVPGLHLWAAAVERDVTPTCLCVEKVTTPVRCPPAVVRAVQESWWLNDRSVLRYCSTAAPAPTDGPAVKEIRHWGSRAHHTRGRPEYCEGCADDIANLMDELRVGQPGGDLQYRDTIFLCDNPRDNMPVVTRLRARGRPVQVVTSRHSEAAIRDVALAVRNAVTVTEWRVVSGLERRVVVVMGRWRVGDYNDRLYAMSRCTSLLVWVGANMQSDGDNDNDDVNDE